MSMRATGKPVEWPTIALIAFVHTGWLAIGLWLWPVAPVLALLLSGVLIALHSSLVHECLHGHPTRNSVLNEALMLLPLGLVWPYRRFKKAAYAAPC